MEHTLVNFLQALRGADVRASTAETLDAMAVMDLVGWSDREALRSALSFALAKSPDEKERFDACFDRFFSATDLSKADTPPPAVADDGGSELVRMMAAGDIAGLQQAMAEAAQKVGVERIRFFTQRGLFTQRILEAMGIEAIDAMIAAGTGAGGGGVGDGAGGDAGSASGAGGAADPKAARTWLFEQARDLVERQLSLHGAETSRDLREDRLRRSRLGNLDRRDQAEMRKLVARIAKRLAAMHSRKRKKRRTGTLDVRRTLRRNYANDGLLFDLEWKHRKIDKPRVFALCDVSGSVASVARFLLQFIYELHELMSEVRTFAFSGTLIETSDYFERLDVDAAVDAVMGKVGYMPTDYGESLRVFREGWIEEIDRRTTVIVLGDGRSNNTDPRTDIMREIRDRAKRVLWLNPEPPPLWGTGDSEMRRYSPYCHIVRECSTLGHLERFVDELLHTTDRAA